MATRGELASTHMSKKSPVKNWLHEYQLLASVMSPLGGTVHLAFAISSHTIGNIYCILQLILLHFLSNLCPFLASYNYDAVCAYYVTGKLFSKEVMPVN